MLSNIDEFLYELVKQKGIPYLDVACMQEHKPVYRGVFGRNATGRENLYMYSCSKPITVIAFGQLYEQGKIIIDAPVADYIPEFSELHLINGKKAEKTMTVRHLLTMTGGLDYNYFPESVKNLLASDGNASTLQIVCAYAKAPLQFEPGEKFYYSLCHDVLAAVIEVSSGMKFSDYVEQYVFSPLGMVHSTFANIAFDKMADVYAYRNGIVRSNGFVPTTPCYESGGSGLISTVNDYMRFADALACSGVSDQGYRVIRTNTLKEITSEQISNITVNNNFTCIQGNDYGYGLGMRVRTVDTEWGLKKGEFGWDGAAGSYLLVDPDRKISVVIGMHLLGWPAIFMGEHLNIVKTIYKNIL